MSNQVIIKASTPLNDDLLYAATTARLETVPVGESRWEIEAENPDSGFYLCSEPYSEKSEAEEDARKIQKIFPGADVTVGIQYAQHRGLAESARTSQRVTNNSEVKDVQVYYCIWAGETKTEPIWGEVLDAEA